MSVPRAKVGAVVLTDALVRRATPRGVSEIMLADARCPGLVLRVRASGARTWVLRRTLDGKQRRDTLGSAVTMDVAAARAAALRVLAAVEHPSPAPAGPRLASFAPRYRATMAERWKPSTLVHFDTVLRAHLLPAFGPKRLDAITAADVAAWFYELSRRSPGSANRVLATFKAMLNTARSWAVLRRQAPDPTAFIRRNRPAAVGRALTLEQLTRLGHTLDRSAGRFPDETVMIRLILLSGCRPGEIYRLRWSEVKPDRLMLGDSKTGPRSVLLARSALALVDGLRREQGERLRVSASEAHGRAPPVDRALLGAGSRRGALARRVPTARPPPYLRQPSRHEERATFRRQPPARTSPHLEHASLHARRR